VLGRRAAHGAQLCCALSSPHPSSLHHLTLLTRLKVLSLAANQDDAVSRIGLHCLPSSLTSLTLQSLNVVAAPLAHAAKAPAPALPRLSHLHLKSCSLPSMAAFAGAPSLEWLHLDNCEAGVYLGEVCALWGHSLSWLEVSYTHMDWRLLSGPEDMASVAGLSRLRKLTLITPHEEGVSLEGLLALKQLRLLSLSPGPALASRAALRGLCGHAFLAGLELKLYSDVAHHEELALCAALLHAELQESCRSACP